MRRTARPEISKIPGQQFALDLTLQPTPAPTPAPVAECACSGVGIFWEDTTSPGTYDVTSVTFTSVQANENLYPRAALVGDTCPGLDTSGINVTWSGGIIPPQYRLVKQDQTWALVVTEISWASGASSINGTLTASGSVECGGETISVGPITFTIDLPTGGPGPTPPS